MNEHDNDTFFNDEMAAFDQHNDPCVDKLDQSSSNENARNFIAPKNVFEYPEQ
jgi:hypothetical protein